MLHKNCRFGLTYWFYSAVPLQVSKLLDSR